jgi:nicotinate-nucleotide pyrophosphorylase (carboxylating)
MSGASASRRGEAISEPDLFAIVDLALSEDLGRGDVTTDSLVPPDIEGEATILIKADGVFAGGRVADLVFRRVDPDLKVELFRPDGSPVKAGEVVGKVSGSVASILKAERVALNFIQRMSGIASLTAEYVARVAGTKAGIYDTRKTTPGLRFLEKYSVLMGGGHNHRLDLGDFVLIKDNHIAICRRRSMTITDIVNQARAEIPRGMKLEIEVTSVKDAEEAARAGADIIMFDNMSGPDMKMAVSMLPGSVKTEASGGINLATVRDAALTGVDIISVGALTHSVKALDISLELEL